MEIRQLRQFIQIAESGNFSRAAAVLNVAQPSLTQQVRNLETELGVELFRRHARGATLTELGQQFYEHALRIVKSVDHTKEVIRSNSANPSGKISVGLPTSAARNLSLPLYRALERLQPNISLHLVEAMSGYLDDWIQEGRLDVALIYDHKAYENVAWTEMIAENLMLFVRPDSPLAGIGEIAFREAFGRTVVLPGRPHVLRTVVETLAAREGMVIDAIDCDSLPAIAKLVCGENFWGVMPHFSFIDEIRREEMVAIPIVNPVPSWRLSVVVSQRTINPRGSDAVAAVMAKVIADLVQSGTWRARLKCSALL